MSKKKTEAAEPECVIRTQGKLERLFHERVKKDHATAVDRGFRFMPDLAERPIKFIEDFCKHHKGEWAGEPLRLEEWQKEILREAFGWVRSGRQWGKEEGSRRFRIVYIEIPRKNGKSELAGGLGLFLVLADGEEGAEVYSSATKKDQARIVWSTSEAMVKKSPQLKRWIKPFKHSLIVEKTGSSFQPLGADSDTLDGLNPHGNLVDELHAHRTRALWDVLQSAMGSRRQPLTIAITTAGVYDKESIGWAQHEYATKILEGHIEDDEFFAFITAADEGDDYFSVETQMKANPNYGVSVKPGYLASQAKKAQEEPGSLNEYLVKHLNVWTQQAKRWLPMDKWSACEPDMPAGAGHRALVAARETKLEGLACRGGLDLSSKLDLTALVLEFQLPNDKVELVSRFWLPEAKAKEYARKGQKQYDAWVRDGWLKVTPGNAVDYEFIRVEVNELAKRFSLQELAFDPWGATDLAIRLGNDGITMVECRQGYKTLSEPSKDIIAKVVEGQVKHMNHPIMTFCASNAVVTTDAAGNIKPDKQAAPNKIDGIVAWVMARSRGIVSVGDQGDDPGGYNETGTFKSL